MVSEPHEHGRIHLLQGTRERELGDNGTPQWTAPLEYLESSKVAVEAVVTGSDPVIGGQINKATQLSVAERLLLIGGQREFLQWDGQTLHNLRQSFLMCIHFDIRGHLGTST
jgi:hypothetical protein